VTNYRSLWLALSWIGQLSEPGAEIILAADSLLEEEGFEPSVPHKKDKG